MPDGTIQTDFAYRPAKRGSFAPLIMLSGPSGVGKSFSALRLASGMVGPSGRIFVADTDNNRALLYADKFNFLHCDLKEPFRPMLFEQAAIAAQQQGAQALIIDNFGHEWAGPGGILSWHEEELDRMAGDNFQRREQVKMIAWAKVKPAHKHMLQRLYQINLPIIFCASAEKKIAMIKQEEGKDRGKVLPVDQGFQPVGDKDIAFAMTLSLMLEDPARPGVPRPVKALLEDLKPIIHLDRPLDEATGVALAAWARGEKRPASQEAGVGRGETPGDSPPAPESHQPNRTESGTDEERIAAGARDLAARFLGTASRLAHLTLVDDPDVQRQMDWLKKHRKQLWDREVNPAIKASWKRTQPKQADAKQGDLMP